MIAATCRLFALGLPTLALGGGLLAFGGSGDEGPAAGGHGRADRARVVRAVDGDTLVVRLGGREESVRLLGVDAPESYACGGGEATAALGELTDSGARIRLVGDPSQDRRDGYGRLLRYAELGGADLGLAQLRGSHASVYVFDEAFARIHPYRRAERAGREHGRGMRGSCGAGAEAGP